MDFTKSMVQPAVTTSNKLAIITDGKTLTKLTLFEQFGTKIKLGQSYIMRGYSLGEVIYYIRSMSMDKQSSSAPLT